MSKIIKNSDNKKLVISELTYRRLFESAQDGILIVNFHTGKILDVNQFLINKLGYPKSVFLKKHLWEIGEFKDIVASRENFSILQKKKYIRFENLPLETKNGEKIDVEFVSNVYKEGNITIIQCNIRDITARRIVEKKVEENEELFRYLFENINSGAVIYEPIQNGKNFIIKKFNSAAEKMEKVKRNEIIGKSVLKIFPGVKKFGLFAVFQRVWKTGKAEHLPLSFYKDNRITGWKENYVCRLPNKNIVAIYDDRTKEKQEEEQDFTRLKREEAILMSICDAVFAINTNGNILLFNKMAEKLTGFLVNEAIGANYKKILNFINEDNKKTINNSIDEATHIHKTFKTSNHTMLINKNGTKIPIKYSLSSIKNFKGEIIGCVIVFRDITKEMEVDRAKTEFVSLASHQLRTPLTSINWVAEMLLKGDIGEITNKQKESLEIINNSGKRMADLVSSLLNVSRLELGTFAVTPKPVKINLAIDEVLNDLAQKINDKKLQIKQNYPTDLPLIKADPVLLRIIIQNILANAVHYTFPETIILIKIIITDNNFLLTITDQGIGISSEDKTKIFTKLFRTSNAQLFRTDGTGLGLYIVKLILDAIGGKIWFESEINKGSSFYISLPQKGMKPKKGTKTLELKIA